MPRSSYALLCLQVFSVLDDLDINVKMISQGASKTNISLIVPSESAEEAVKALHADFFGVTDACAASEAALNKAKPAAMA
jgi:aspartate kinase